jgi:hypothetical protein
MGGTGPGAIIGTGVFVAFLVGVYVMPSIIAFSRLHPRRWAILAINLLLGISGIGWGIAFIWALLPAQDGPPAGGEGPPR